MMNEKFFDLKKEKQDRMINGSMKIFALNGYDRASTDDMVKEAGISKGLWFHYFGSKLGLYSFIADYAMKYMILELNMTIGLKETDYFVLKEQVLQAMMAVRKDYPYLPLFVQVLMQERSMEAIEEAKDARKQYCDRISLAFANTDISLFRDHVDVEWVKRMLEDNWNCMIKSAYAEDAFPEEYFLTEAVKSLNLMKQLTYK